MSLSDLIKYIPAQTRAINQLSSGLDSTTVWCTAWTGFRDALWGKGLESLQRQERVKRDDNPVEDVDLLPDPRPLTRFVATAPGTRLPGGWSFDTQRILVRPEYLEAEKAAVLSSETNDNVFAVNGQPGIGSFPSFPIACRI
jgi:hypothetical protein